MYLLDSSIIINFLKNVPSVVQTIAKLDDSISSSYICLSELYEGIFRQKTKEKIENTEKQIISFFEELDKIWALDEHIAREFGKIRTYLRACLKTWYFVISTERSEWRNPFYKRFLDSAPHNRFARNDILCTFQTGS